MQHAVDHGVGECERLLIAQQQDRAVRDPDEPPQRVHRIGRGDQRLHFLMMLRQRVAYRDSDRIAIDDDQVRIAEQREVVVPQQGMQIGDIETPGRVACISLPDERLQHRHVVRPEKLDDLGILVHHLIDEVAEENAGFPQQSRDQAGAGAGNTGDDEGLLRGIVA